jgi:hypothetical protein
LHYRGAWQRELRAKILHQQREAIKRRDRGEESLTEIGRTHNVSAATISRLAT